MKASTDVLRKRDGNAKSGSDRRAGKKQKGLSLIEILVVITIISVLAGILFPVFSAARKAAKKAKSISNLKQIATAMILCADSNGGQYAISGYRPTGFWMSELGLTSTDGPILEEPMYVKDPGTNSYIGKFHAGYARNTCLVSQHSVRETAATALIATVQDFGGSATSPEPSFPISGLNMPDSVLFDLWLKDRGYIASHGFGATAYFGKGTYAFVDGHVKAVPPEAFDIPNEPNVPAPAQCSFGANQPDGSRLRFAPN
jgi:prepilin-type N-terminal cleavage/methylation domain-containing protein/prepilin-type processing-associated H-X9-DG protein